METSYLIKVIKLRHSSIDITYPHIMWRGCDNVSDPVAKSDSWLMSVSQTWEFAQFESYQIYRCPTTKILRQWEPSLCREPLNSAARVWDGASVAVSSPAAAGGAGRGCQLTPGQGRFEALGQHSAPHSHSAQHWREQLQVQRRSEVIFMWSYGEKSDFGARAPTATQGECFLSLKSVKCQCPVLESAEKRKHVK